VGAYRAGRGCCSAALIRAGLDRVDLFAYQCGSPIVRANALQGPIHPTLGIAMDMSIQLKAESGAICTLSPSFNNDGPLGAIYHHWRATGRRHPASGKLTNLWRIISLPARRSLLASTTGTAGRRSEVAGTGRRRGTDADREMGPPPGASPPMRMTASWSGSKRTCRIQVWWREAAPQLASSPRINTPDKRCPTPQLKKPVSGHHPSACSGVKQQTKQPLDRKTPIQVFEPSVPERRSLSLWRLKSPRAP
jgi:hypothetical protein